MQADGAPGALPSPRRVSDALSAAIAGSGAARLVSASLALFEAGGKLLLDEGTKRAVRGVAERAAESTLAMVTGPLIGPVGALARPPRALIAQASGAARALGPVAVRAAGAEILKGATRAAGIGLAIDGAIASVEAAAAVRRGTLDRRGAASYVAKEAAAGAVATGTGVLVGAGFVVLTGGAATPVVFAVGALGSIGARRALRRFTRAPRAVQVREIS